jgi:hypothetical protein
MNDEQFIAGLHHRHSARDGVGVTVSRSTFSSAGQVLSMMRTPLCSVAAIYSGKPGYKSALQRRPTAHSCVPAP